MSTTPVIYLAAPLFNPRERQFNDELAVELSKYGRVFLPQRDGELLAELVSSGVTPAIAERRVFEADLRAIRSASLMFAVLDGGHVDEGVAFEIGFMNALNKACIGLQTDVRRALPSGNNPMISRGLHEVFEDIERAIGWVSAWSARFRETARRHQKLTAIRLHSDHRR
jgi:nucleoside 2-deoxyribosyltransferase